MFTFTLTQTNVIDTLTYLKYDCDDVALYTKCHLKTLSSSDDDQKVFGKTKPPYYLKQLSNSLKRREKQKTTYIDPTINLRRLSE